MSLAVDDFGTGYSSLLYLFGRPMPAEAMARHLGLEPGAG